MLTLSFDAVHDNEMLVCVEPVTARPEGVDGGVVSLGGGGSEDPPLLNVLSALSRSGLLDSVLPDQVHANVIIPLCRDAAHCASMWLSSSTVGQRQIESWKACATPQ